MEKKNVLGGILIILGGFWLLESMNFITVDLTLVVVAAVLLILYFLSGKSASARNVGLLIGGSIVLMVGIHTILNSLFSLGDVEGVLFFLLLGSAFWIVQFFHYNKVSGNKWPTYVGSALYGFSGIIFFSEYLDRGFFKYIWSFGLIIVGLYIIFKDRIKA